MVRCTQLLCTQPFMCTLPFMCTQPFMCTLPLTCAQRGPDSAEGTQPTIMPR